MAISAALCLLASSSRPVGADAGRTLLGDAGAPELAAPSANGSLPLALFAGLSSRTLGVTGAGDGGSINGVGADESCAVQGWAEPGRPTGRNILLNNGFLI